MTKATFTAASLAALLFSSAQAAPRPDEAITGDRLRTHLEFIAHDLLEGRNTPSRGLDIAALYIRSMLKQWGVAPGGPDGSYFQPFALERKMIVKDRCSAALNGSAWAYGVQYYGTSGTATEAKGGLVFVGNGVKSAENDPYKGLDVKGKWIVVAGGRGRRGGGTRPEDVARLMGALGVITISSAPGPQFQSRAEASVAAGQPALVDPKRTSINQITISPEAAQALFAGEKVQAGDLVKDGTPAASFALSDAKVLAATVFVERSLETTQNVVAKIEGTDPKLNIEAVAVSAHYDHIGMRTTGEDRIFNGADDDGSGTVAVLELARAFSLGKRPKRTIYFIWHAGEERGLWGSAYMVENPVMPLDKLVALINIDMIGRSKKPGDTNPRNARLTGPEEVFLVGSNRISKDLGDVLVKSNRDRYKLNLNYHYDQPNDPENIYGRSDHYNYALKGVPIAFFFSGINEDYHGVGDEVEKIDFVKMEKVTRTIHAALWDLATRRDRPRLNPKQQVP